MKKLISLVVIAGAVIGGNVYAAPPTQPINPIGVTTDSVTTKRLAFVGLGNSAVTGVTTSTASGIVEDSNADNALTTQGYVDKQVGGVNTRVDGLQNQVNALGSRINEVERNANAGIAGVAAMSQIQVAPGKDFAVGAGVGTYRGQSSVAIGAAARLNENLHVRAGFSSSGVVAAGVTYSW